MGLVGNLSVGRFTGVRLPVSTGGVIGKTYAEYQAAIAALATDGSVVWGTGIAAASRSVTTTAAAATGTMNGTSWLTHFQFASPSRVVQHGLQSEADFNEQAAGGFDVFLQYSSLGALSATGITRNGFTSASNAGASAAAELVRIIRWSPTEGKAYESNPSIGGAEVEFVF